MLIGLQYLRGVAALMIVYFHAVGPVERLTGTALPVSFSGSGVDLFFVLSGCVMWLSTHGREVGPGPFLLNRLVRVAPLYWILTLAVAGLAFAAPALLRSTAFDPAHLVASLLFLPWPNPRYPGLFPVIIPGWTLNYEMFFYAVFALMLPFRPAWRAAGTLAGLGGLVLVGQMVQPGSGLAAFYTDAIVLEFGLGVLVGALFTSRIAVPPRAALAAAALGLGLLAALDGTLPKLVAASLPAALVVGGLALYERGAAVPRL
ncbi:acyltransferase, partial [uncultured Methylobacterium sp.]